MTLPELLKSVSASTGASESEIQARVRAAWPGHTAFTETQAALMVHAIEKTAGRVREGRR